MTWSKYCHLLFLGAVVSLAGTTCGQALDLFSDAKPQAQTDTCQSYAIMLALAAQGDGTFPITTFGELRQAEAEFRSIANGISGGPFAHEALAKALTQYTDGQYTLHIEDISGGITEWMARVRQLTLLETTADVLIAQLTGTSFPVVLTSVTKFGSSSYTGGHVMAVLGIAGNGLNSNTEILAFNSAIKGGGAVNRCEAGTQPGDMRYTAGVVSTNDFELKGFPNYRILFLEKN